MWGFTARLGNPEQTDLLEDCLQNCEMMVFIDPYYNHKNGLYGGKWFSPRLGTDSALALGIAYTWLTEGTYDKEYVETHTHGFDEWKDYVLGTTDSTPKTAEWAAEETGIPARDIRALAREWAKHKTMLAAGGLCGRCRICIQNV